MNNITTDLTLEQISGFLEKQQKVIHIIDKSIQSIQPDCKKSPVRNRKNPVITLFPDHVMHHIFGNIRNSYQDGIFISQGLLNTTSYYNSASLDHAQRTAQEHLIDLAYIMSDYIRDSGNEYLRYLKFLIDKETKRYGQKLWSEEFYNNIFPPNLDLKSKSSSQWSHTKPKDKIKKGLKLYNIENPELAESRNEYHSILSSGAHGNENTAIRLTAKKSSSALRTELYIAMCFFDITLKSAVECYFRLYLNRKKDYEEIDKKFFS